MEEKEKDALAVIEALIRKTKLLEKEIKVYFWLPSNIQVAAVQSEETEAIGTESITVSYRGSSKNFEEKDMKDPRTAKMFFKCVKMKINKNNKDTNNKMKIIDDLETEIRKLEASLSKYPSRKYLDALHLQNKIQKLEVAVKRLNAKSRLTAASEVKSEKPEGTRYGKRKIVKRSKTESATGTRTTIPHIKSGELEFAAERTASPIEEENNRCITFSDLNANKPPMKKRTAKSRVSRSTCEVKTENTNSLEDEKLSYSLPNELGIQITDVWSLDKEIESDEPATLEQSNEIIKTENAAMLLKNVTMVKPLHSSRVAASEAEYEAVETVLRKWASSEKRVGTKSATKSGSCKSSYQANGNFKKKKKKKNLPTVYGREQFYNFVPPNIYTGYPVYLNTFPSIQLGYPSYINLPYNIQMGTPACANMFPTVVQVFYPAFPTVQMGYPAYLSSHPGRPNILPSFGGIPASNFLTNG